MTQNQEIDFSVLEYLVSIVSGLVAHPDKVKITETKGSDCTLFEIRVEDSDAGRVIGRQARIVDAIRILAAAAAYSHGLTTKYHIVVLDSRRLADKDSWKR